MRKRNIRQGSSCPSCGYPIYNAKEETEQDRINVRGKNKGKIFLIFGSALFLVSMVFGIGTSNAELALRAKKLTRGLYGSEALEWLFLRYAPTLILWISIIFVVIGIIFLIIYKRKK